MNTWLNRKFSAVAHCMTMALFLAACSGSSDDPAPGGSGGTAGGGAGTSGKAGSSGTGGSKGDAGGGGEAGSNPMDSTELVGSFQVQVVADEMDPAKGLTSVIGRVNDGPSPSAVIWTVSKEDGDCRLEVPSVPFCEAGCGSGVCVADGRCQEYPVAHTVGTVTIKGAKLAAGGAELTLREVAKNYQPPAGTSFAYPPFAEGDAIALHAEGGDYGAFDLSAKGVAPLTFTSTDFELDKGKALELTWEAAANPKNQQVHLKLDISHHGGSKGMIECDTDDSGSLTISAELMTELIGLGVAGFPSVIMTRASSNSTKIAPGRVELSVSSKVERFVTVAGVKSCTEDTDCTDGATCQADLTCK